MTLTLSDSQLLTLYNALSSFSMELDDNKEHWKDLMDVRNIHQKNISDVIGMMRDDLRRIAAPPSMEHGENILQSQEIVSRTIIIDNDEYPCTCKPDCPKTCTGRSCGCDACFNAYCDAMEYD